MDRINMDEFVVGVALEEEGEVEINIAEIKQILKIGLEKLGGFEDEQILELIGRYKEI